jgi:hypothetical protein
VAEYPENFKKTMDGKDYLSQQVLNLDETGLFRKKCPMHSFISQNAKTSHTKI